MEDVLDLYAEPYDPHRPVVCFDETSTQLLAEVRAPQPVWPGRPRRQDYEYRRAGTRNLFLTCEPLAGWRHVAINERRTMEDFAHQMQWLVDVVYLNAPVVRVVLDNLNTHRMASLCNCSELRGSPAFPTRCGRVAKHRSCFANRSHPLKREQLPPFTRPSLRLRLDVS